jgi:ATP:ADP antiporter, AAA family
MFVVIDIFLCVLSLSDNKLVDIMPKHHLFYAMGSCYAVIFMAIAFLLNHPTIGIENTVSDPTRLLGWVSYVAIESFGSIVIQCYWALINASVDVAFAKKNYGIIVAGAQIGSILGPTVATQAEMIGVPGLYMGGSFCMVFMVLAMYMYIQRFGPPVEKSADGAVADKKKDKGGVLEGFYLFYEHDFVKGIFAVSSLFMVQFTVFDYMMKVLAKDKFELLFPDDPQQALRGFASFMGRFGQVTNTISFVFSLLGTGFVIEKFGLTITLISFPVLMLACTLIVWLSPTLWTIFAVMMVVKGMGYALNNPCKEILYQVTSSSVKFKCKSWIDTMGQRGCKAAGSLITNAFANSMGELLAYGNGVGLLINIMLLFVSRFMGRKFDELSETGHKVGEEPLVMHREGGMHDVDHPDDLEMEGEGEGEGDEEDSQLGLEDEGQSEHGDDHEGGGGGDVEMMSAAK